MSQIGLFDPPSPALTWKEVLHGERDKDYFKNLMSFIERERTAGKTVFPKNSEIFNSIQLTSFENVKVVIIGQDPYHGPNQAHGLCFSVREGITPPPSLQNIFKELQSDLGLVQPKSGCLEKWTRQGVLLLNAVLSVEAGKAGSHANMGWETFTDRIIRELNDRKRDLVFLLWGSYAQKKGAFIDPKRHLVLRAPHPSPLSAYSGFFGCRHFSKANEFLKSKGLEPVDWNL